MTEDERKGEYDAQKRRFGRATTQTDPETGEGGDMATWARHWVDITNLYRGQPNGFKRCLDEAERRCAESHGFPPFAEWQDKLAIAPNVVSVVE
jgi:hypothetical protein